MVIEKFVYRETLFWDRERSRGCFGEVVVLGERFCERSFEGLFREVISRGHFERKKERKKEKRERPFLMGE